MPIKNFLMILVLGLSAMVIAVDMIRQNTDIPAVTAPLAANNPANDPANDNIAPRLSPQRRTHILYGDAQGGGHMHGTGKPCKSEFPAEWTAEDIVHAVTTLAANDNINWKTADNGYHTAEQTVDGIKIRIVTDREGDDIVTAYPVNVRRNPCPSAGGAGP